MTPIQIIAMTGLAPLVAAMWIHMGLVLVPLIGRVLIALGIGWTVFTGFDTLYSQVETYANTAFAGLPADVIALVAIARMDDAAALLLSAIAVKMAYKYTLGSIVVFSWLGIQQSSE